MITGALNIPTNDYDRHTLEPAIEQQQRLTGHILKEVAVDRGNRGIKEVKGTPTHPYTQTLRQETQRLSESQTKERLLQTSCYRTCNQPFKNRLSIKSELL